MYLLEVIGPRGLTIFSREFLQYPHPGAKKTLQQIESSYPFISYKNIKASDTGLHPVIREVATGKGRDTQRWLLRALRVWQVRQTGPKLNRILYVIC